MRVELEKLKNTEFLTDALCLKSTLNKEQLDLLENVAKIIVNLVKEGNQIVLTHGNGPQVGQILLAMDYSANGEAHTPSMPFPECGSMSQGYIGYQLQQCLQDELERQKMLTSKIRGEHFFTCAVLLSLMTLPFGTESLHQLNKSS